jgi:competence protein ComEC
LSVLARYPRHAVLGALVVGMLAAHHPVALLLVPLVSLRRPAVALLLLAAALSGSWIAQARMAHLDRTSLTPQLGHSVGERVFLASLPRETSFGGWQATVLLRGEHVALTAGRWVARPAVPIGAELNVSGTLKPLSPAQAWMRGRNVHAALSGDAVRATGASRGGFAGFVDGVRWRAEHALEAGAPRSVSGLSRGMVLGEGEALDPVMQDDFRAASLTHLVAASGQNVALLAALAIALGTALGLGLRGRLTLALALVVLYVPLAGAGPSIQRAGIMGGAALVAALGGRPAARAYALLLAAALTLLANPRAAADPGWQLSFVAVIGIALGTGRVATALRERRVPAGAAEVTAMTVAATIATAPLIALHFGRASPIGLPANVLAAPAVAPAMWLGALAAAVGQVSASLAAPLAALAALPTAYLAWLGHAAAHLPGANLRLPLGVVIGVCVAAAALIIRPRRTPRRRARRGVLALALFAIAVLTAAAAARHDSAAPAAATRISFLDVGQGDATLIQAGGRAVLVDAGPMGDHIAALVRGEGARRLDLLVITHAQADHEGGAAEVLSQLPVSAVLDGRDGIASPDGTRLQTAARTRRVRMFRPSAGQILRAGPIRLDVLSPPAEGRIPGEDPNTRAIVLRATISGVTVLLPADAESDVLSALPLAPVDLLKVSHHGSADPGLPALLDILRPRAAVIEVGHHNPYGHPAPSTLRALKAGMDSILRTDNDGTVRFELRDGRLSVTTNR